MIKKERNGKLPGTGATRHRVRGLQLRIFEGQGTRPNARAKPAKREACFLAEDERRTRAESNKKERSKSEKDVTGANGKEREIGRAHV